MITETWSDLIDPASIPDAILHSEAGRRNSAKRKNPGRKKRTREVAPLDPQPKGLERDRLIRDLRRKGKTFAEIGMLLAMSRQRAAKIYSGKR